MSSPPPPDPGAEVDSYAIVNGDLNGSGVGDVDFNNLPLNKNNPNWVTITDSASNPITELTVSNLGGAEKDVVILDLSTFQNNFTVFLANETPNDILMLDGVHTFTDNGDGTQSISYYGSDSQLHYLLIDADTAQVEPYYAPDGIVDGGEGAEDMDGTYEDYQEDSIDGTANEIYGNGGTDTIDGGGGADTIFGDYDSQDGLLTPGLPDGAFSGTPAGPAPGAEVDTRTLTNTLIDANGQAKITIDSFANKDNANDVTINDGGTDDLNLLIIEKGGDGDGEADVFRLDLSGYNDDFDIELKNTDEFDTLVLTNVHTIEENNDGTWTVTYYGSDSQLHTIGTITLENASIEGYVTADAPYFFDDEILGGAGDDVIDGGFGDDSIDGGADDDSIIGGVGQDTLIGDTGADTIYGDYSADLVPEDAPGTPDLNLDGTSNDWNINGGVWNMTVSDAMDPADADHIRFYDDGTISSLIELGVDGFDDGGEQDILEFDLASFNDDFLISIASKGVANDEIYLTGVYSSEFDEASNIWTVTYYGSDETLHTVTLNPGDAEVTTFFGPAPDSAFADSADSISGGAGDDVLDGGFGDDTIDGGADDDDIDGGTGDDEITGGTGADTIYGGDGEADVALERVAFQWSDIPDPDDGGQIDNLDEISTGSQTVGGTTIDFTVTGGMGQYETTTVYTTGIDAGAGSVDTNSSLGLDGADGTVTLDFSTPVENLEFNINDFEANSETLVIKAYDADGNLIAFTVSEGSGITGTDSDTISGNDTFEGPLSNTGDNSAVGSINVSIPGPVASLELIYTQTNGSLTVTDMHFDDPATGLDLIGNDDIDAGAGDDVILAGLGDDTIDGGTGTDTYDADTTAALADETITVTLDQNGDGTSVKSNDGTTDTLSSIERIIAAEAAAEADAITINGNILRGDISGISDNAVGIFTPSTGPQIAFGGSGEPTINEILSGNYDPGTGTVKPRGHYEINSGEEDGAQIGQFYVENFEEMDFDVICFTRSTRIATARGEVAFEHLCAGDLVETMDHGLQPIRWIGSTRAPAQDHLAPVKIEAGTLGNTRDLRVSPQHRMLIGGWQVELCFGEDEVFASAKSLVNGDTITRETGGSVEYFHILFDRHEIIFAEGAPSESFHPGKVGLATLSDTARAEVLALMPELALDPNATFPTARTCLKAFEASLLDPMNFGCIATASGALGPALRMAA